MARFARRRRRPKAIDTLRTAETRGFHEVDDAPRQTIMKTELQNGLRSTFAWRVTERGVAAPTKQGDNRQFVLPPTNPVMRGLYRGSYDIEQCRPPNTDAV